MGMTEVMGLLGGLALFLYGMQMMSSGMEAAAGDKMKGILAGTVFTALIQSSSASVGILQALANSNVVTLSSAAFVLFGQNIGTCITAFLAALGTSRNAKRTTIIHIMFNIIGTIIFTSLCMVTPLIAFMEGTAPGNPAAQIANLHTTFNVVTSILLIPFGTLLAVIAEKLLPERAEEESGLRLCYIHSTENMKSGV